MGKYTKVLGGKYRFITFLIVLFGLAGTSFLLLYGSITRKKLVQNRVARIEDGSICDEIDNKIDGSERRQSNTDKMSPAFGQKAENKEVVFEASNSKKVANKMDSDLDNEKGKKVASTHEISLSISDVQTLSSDFFTIKRLVFDKRLKAGETYKITVSEYKFNEWIIKWEQPSIQFTAAGNIASVSSLANEGTTKLFEVYIEKDKEEIQAQAKVNSTKALQNKALVPINIHADVVTSRAKNIGTYVLGTVGEDTNSAVTDNLSFEHSTTSNKSLEMISQIIYTTGEAIYIKPIRDFTLSSIELWQVKDSSDESNKILTTTDLVIDNADSEATVSSQSTADLTAYETAYNLDVTSGLKFSTLNIIPRSVWGVNPSTWDPVKKTLDINDIKRLKYIPEYDCRWLPEYYRPTRFVIHHTVTSNYPTDPLREIREIYIYHAYSRGWGDIGYNYIIDSSGRIFEGKIGGDGGKGYHAFEAANDMTIGIALIGDFTYTNPTSAQLEALKKLLAEKAALYNIPLVYTGTGSLSDWLNKYITVFGHRHVWVWDWDTNSWYYRATACPGEKFVASGTLKSTVQSAADYLQNNFSNIKDARNWALQMLENYKDADNIYVQVTFANPGTRDELIKKAPHYSGIKNLYVAPDGKLHLTIGVIDNHACGWIVPPKGWNGYDSCGSQGCMYFPTYNGPYDRAVILFTLFKLNPLYKEVKLVKGDVGWIEGR